MSKRLTKAEQQRRLRKRVLEVLEEKFPWLELSFCRSCIHVEFSRWSPCAPHPKERQEIQEALWDAGLNVWVEDQPNFRRLSISA